jgi:hypothetical protein
MNCDDLNSRSSGLLEDDGFVAVEKDAVFDVPGDGAGKDYIFDVGVLLS